MYSTDELAPTRKQLLKQFVKLCGMSIKEQSHQVYFEFLKNNRLFSEKDLSLLSLQDSDGLNLEGIKVLVYAEKIKRKEVGQVFDCHVMHVNSLLNFIKELTNPENIPAIGKRRIQVIVAVGRKDFHYATCDFELSDSNNYCFLLDAANAINMMEISEVLSDAVTQKYLTRVFWAKNEMNGGVQRDRITCPIHAFFHACQVSRIENLFQFLELKSNPSNHFYAPDAINWMRVMPILVILAEKAWWLQNYRDNTEKNSYAESNPNFAKIKIEGHELTFDDLIQETKNLNDKALFPALVEFKRLQEATVPLIHQLSDNELDIIINTKSDIKPVEGRSLALLWQELNEYRILAEQLIGIIDLYDNDDSSESDEEKQWTSKPSKDWQLVLEGKEKTKDETNIEEYGDKQSIDLSELRFRIHCIKDDFTSLNEAIEQLQKLISEAIDSIVDIPGSSHLVKDLHEFLNSLSHEEDLTIKSENYKRSQL